MQDADYEAALARAHAHGLGWIASLDRRPVAATASADEVHAAGDRPFPEHGRPAADIIDELARWAEPGLAAVGSGRYLALVTGGGLPAALGADWMVSAWDQNASFASLYPAVAAIEQVAARWVIESLDLPAESAVGFTTGAQGANTACLLAARHVVLAAHGHDVELDGLIGAPPVTVIVSDEQHSTLFRSLRFVGLGARTVVRVATDEVGRADANAFAAAIGASEGPTIVCAQAGNVNGGSFDPLNEIASAVEVRRERRDDIWFHIDGAFGLWVRASAAHRHRADGAERADSWTSDAHKWLNTPYDCGIAVVRQRAALTAAVGLRAEYLPDRETVPDPVDSVPEASRRARGVPVWAALRSLGRTGLEELVDRCCRHAAAIAEGLAALDGLRVRHQEINQIVVEPDTGDAKGLLDRIVADGRCHPSITEWQGRPGIRVSVSNWRTDESDVEQVVSAFADALGDPS